MSTTRHSDDEFDVDAFVAWLTFSDDIEREIKRSYPQYTHLAVLIGIRLSSECKVEGSESATLARQAALRETMLYAPTDFVDHIERALHKYDH